MAKVKIKGYYELVDISENIGIELKKILQDSSFSKDRPIDLGNVLVKKQDIVSVMLTPDRIDKNINLELEWLKEREKKLARPLEEIVNSQESYFNLVKRIYRLKEEWSDVKTKTAEYLRNHPNRLWCDFKIWIGSKFSKAFVNEYEQRIMEWMFKIENVEMEMENQKKQELESLLA